MDRLRTHRIIASRFLELLAFLSDGTGLLDFRKFLGLMGPWLRDLEDDLPDYEVFTCGLLKQSEYLAELENVSIGVRPSLSSHLQLHSLWIECILQRAGHEGRVRWLRQILLLSYMSGRREKTSDLMRPFVLNVVRIIDRFDIRLDETIESPAIQDWLESLMRFREPALQEISTLACNGEESQGSGTKPIEEGSKDLLTEERSLEGMLLDLLSRCRSAAERNVENEEKHAAALRQKYIPLLRRLQSLEEDHQQDLHSHRSVATIHLEIYDYLIAIAPLLHKWNPMLEKLLLARKEKAKSQTEDKSNRDSFAMAKRR